MRPRERVPAHFPARAPVARRPRPMSRSMRRTTALALTERISAVTHLVSSLEYLTNERDRCRGGLNNWSISRRNFPSRSRLVRRAVDVVADRRVTRALHVARAAAAASLLAPLP